MTAVLFSVALFAIRILPCSTLTLPGFLRRRLPPTLGGSPWYARDPVVTFGCTGCGKCCKMDGDVWLAPEEVQSISTHLNMPKPRFEELYARSAVLNEKGEKWLCLVRSNGLENNDLDLASGIQGSKFSSIPGCVFLDPLGRCSIYDVRPVQCSTYPYWPSLIDDKADWESEAVQPDDFPLKPGSSSRHWSLEEGGCEGISHADALPVPEKEIAAKRRMALEHWRRFPDEHIKETTWYL